ncbi:metal ion transporter metal ion transporter [Dactylonectria estremocensis]|uniref:Metal ion transporter metal ion transporter n=1 Tax=Dactylonectria estremocensis TaxID=1079267 RepID=A0A9P9IP58_9HYPO|nr:metal ion transporter metal ion transporter [Dactylonectria estremocensis]
MARISSAEGSYQEDSHHQHPDATAHDLTTNQGPDDAVDVPDLQRVDTSVSIGDGPTGTSNVHRAGPAISSGGASSGLATKASAAKRSGGNVASSLATPLPLRSITSRNGSSRTGGDSPGLTTRFKNALLKFGSFIGPGFMISVAYIDPGNYATDVAAGATYRFRLLFIVLLANIFAIFLQSLCIKLGTVTGLNLAESCRANLPPWLNYVLYFFAEVAIIATDIAEVIGFAIGLNLLVPAIPLVAGCAISILDVMIILFFYRPHGSMQGLRIFEFFIVCLVLAVVICFCFQLSLIKDTPVGDVFKGYLPSSAIIQSKGLYQACGILGATVMPHSLYLGSGIVQPRLRAYDEKHGLLPPGLREPSISDHGIEKGFYVPSLRAIRYSIKASTLELALALFTFALFVNSAILIVSGASLYNNPDAPDADIFSIHALLSDSISPAAGTIFALALLLSGISAGVVCTIAGQMVCEGALDWKMKPWLRRLLTRSISITPSIIIAGAVGRPGLSEALNASQVVLSVVLPFVTAPLIYFTCRKKYMTVQSSGLGFPMTLVDENTTARRNSRSMEPGRVGEGIVTMANSWYTCVIAIIVWVIITGMNVANLVLLGKGE